MNNMSINEMIYIPVLFVCGNKYSKKIVRNRKITQKIIKEIHILYNLKIIFTEWFDLVDFEFRESCIAEDDSGKNECNKR